ncbi:MAG: phosphate ABC transporter substrate-binding protein [Anaerolineae bacterium]|nr:phosphate ABC transporter substrate-binding protein [Anaerolineae bacterium]
MKKCLILCCCLALLLLSGCGGGTSSSENTASPEYTSIQNIGSDTMVNLALAWAEQYQKDNPSVRVSVTGGGSGTGLAALANNTVDIANASRKIKQEELDEAKKQNYNPAEFVVARDAIGVIVNLENPISQLTLEQISQIYKGEVNNWSELGGEDRPIVRLSRETNSGTHVYFLETVIRLGNSKDKSIFSADTLLLPSSEGIISEVSDNPNAIGYDGLGYITPAVKVVAVARKTGDAYVMPSVDTVNNNTYPISRDLYMYTRNAPQGAVKTYLDWILSDEAQKIVQDLGFVPLLKK